jgi:hypothetical protein
MYSNLLYYFYCFVVYSVVKLNLSCFDSFVKFISTTFIIFVVIRGVRAFFKNSSVGGGRVASTKRDHTILSVEKL